MGIASANDVTHRKRAENSGISKKSVSRGDLPREKTVGFRLRAEVRPVAFVAGAARDGGDEKARIERMCISLLMSKSL